MIANRKSAGTILKDHFEDQSINPFGLFVVALLPTLVAVACFRGIQG